MASKKEKLLYHLNDIANCFESHKPYKFTIPEDSQCVDIKYSLDMYHHHYSDIAYEYLEIAYIGNMLSSVSEEISITYSEVEYKQFVLFKVKAIKSNFINVIKRLANLLIWSDDIDNEHFYEFEEFLTFEKNELRK